MSRTATQRAPSNGAATQTVRVACYVRVSVAECADQKFGSLEAQREAIEAFALAQRLQGWLVLPDVYADDGATGGNIDRPGFQRLLRDVEAGKIDIVAVYKFDRLSRRQIDFLRTIEFFEKHGAGFVSITQNLDTSTSMGRCMLSVMSAFAQLEREVISERTRDKIGASRRRGMWTGGRPVLGYDAINKRLVVNEPEADRIRAVFALYQRLGSLLSVVDELRHRQWKNKTWTNERGEVVEGGWFTRTTLHHTLRNPLYAGLVRAGKEVVEGEHEAIVPRTEWEWVQALLRKNAGPTDRRPRLGGNSGTVLLAGLLRCGRCGASMGYHFATARTGGRRNGYYCCATIQKLGADACVSSRAPAGKLEQFVLGLVRSVGRDPKLLTATLAAARKDRTAELEAFKARLQGLARDRAKLDRERERLALAVGQGRASVLKRLDVVEEGIAALDKQADDVRLDLAALDCGTVDADELRSVLADLEGVWSELFPRERARLFGLLLERVEFDADSGEVAISFRPGGPQAVRENR